MGEQGFGTHVPACDIALVSPDRGEWESCSRLVLAWASLPTVTNSPPLFTSRPVARNVSALRSSTFQLHATDAYLDRSGTQQRYSQVRTVAVRYPPTDSSSSWAPQSPTFSDG